MFYLVNLVCLFFPPALGCVTALDKVNFYFGFSQPYVLKSFFWTTNLFLIQSKEYEYEMRPCIGSDGQCL